MTTYVLRSVVLCAAVVALPAAAAAQTGERDRRQITPFLDSTYVGFAVAGGKACENDPARRDCRETTFEADIVPNFVVKQTFFNSVSEELRKSSKDKIRFAWSVVGVPMVKIRMFIKEESAPVRTPSYMPKGTAQLFLFDVKGQDRIRLLALSGTIGHHSNGQDGCLFASSIRDKITKQCPPPVEGVSEATAINRVDGSFSTNYVQVGARFRWMHLGPPDTTNPDALREVDGELTLGTEVELNPNYRNGNFLGGAGIDPDLLSLYGGTRVSAIGGGATRKMPGCYRLEVKGIFKYIDGHPSTVPALASTVEGSCLFKQTAWGLFARYYRGQDYYNLAFLDDARRVQFGMTYSQEGFLWFK